MSTSRSRLTRSIQEIAKRDPDLRRAIEATKPRGDQPSSAGVGTSDAERDRVCCDGSVSGETNPGTEERDTSEGGQDSSSGLNPDDTADISDMGPGSLTGVHDCATGEPICFDGSDFIPPDGWDGPNDPPINPEYQEGIYYAQLDSTGDGDRFALPGAAATFSMNSSPECYAKEGDCKFVDYYKVDLDSWRVDFINPIEVAKSVLFHEYPCGLGHDGTPYCDPDMEDLVLDAWPSDSCVNLAIKGGSIVGSKYDPENDGSYSKPMSEIELCDDFGNSFFLRPSSNGGWKTINATKDAGYLWGSNGQKIAHINGNEYSDPSI